MQLIWSGDLPFIFCHVRDGQHFLLFSSHVCLFPSLSLYLCVGHLPSSRGVWDGHSDRGDHREPLLSGERCLAEQVQGAGAGEAVRGGDGIDPAPGRSLAGDQGAGRRSEQS